jgi:hypothetical protein
MPLTGTSGSVGDLGGRPPRSTRPVFIPAEGKWDITNKLLCPGKGGAEFIRYVPFLCVPILNLMGLDDDRLTYRYRGRDFRLTYLSGRVAFPAQSYDTESATCSDRRRRRHPTWKMLTETPNPANMIEDGSGTDAEIRSTLTSSRRVKDG